MLPDSGKHRLPAEEERTWVLPAPGDDEFGRTVFTVSASAGKSLKVLLMQDFQTAASVLKHRLPHSAKPHPRILPQRGISMPISYYKERGLFHLYNDALSYVIKTADDGQIAGVYYGRRLTDDPRMFSNYQKETREGITIDVPEPGCFTPVLSRAEYPVYGTGDYRTPAFEVRNESNGSLLGRFEYQSHRIYAGKKDILPLPSTYTMNDDEADTLEITLHDPVLHTDLLLSYTIFRDFAVITRHASFLHHGESPVSIRRAMSMSVDFDGSAFTMLQLSGAWAREKYVKTRPLAPGISAIQGIDGTCGGCEQNPFLALMRPDASEDTGEVYGFSLVYSGNFLGLVEVSSYDITRIMMGIHPINFTWRLEKGESFTTPETVMVYSGNGLNGMSQTYHSLYKTRLQRGPWREKERPILLNNWEATHMSFDEDKILRIAEKAKDVGAELFVLDDGWFGERNDATKGLGDWFVNKEKLPSGIDGLSEKIEAMGLQFGLWVELEMVNKDSRLFREHPDYVIGEPGRFNSTGRHQYVLDFTRQEVVDAVYEMICRVISGARISYIKWDLNRYMSEPFGKELPPERQGEFMHRYILGVYGLYQRLTERFPSILFESCASGGKRFDPGMMYYAPQTWTSDDTDANERVKIQYGTSMVYPLISMGSHVSAVPNEQMNRVTPLASRANVAYFGTFGYELDLNLLSAAEIEMVKEQVRFMKKYRRLIQVDGIFYRILSPFESNECGWIVVSPDRTRALALYFQTLNQVEAPICYFRLKALDPGMNYHIAWWVGGKKKEMDARGDELMYAGIQIPRADLTDAGGDFTSVLFEIVQAE